jgi:hypothetical protein
LISACAEYSDGEREALYQRTGQPSVLWQGFVSPCH